MSNFSCTPCSLYLFSVVNDLVRDRASDTSNGCCATTAWLVKRLIFYHCYFLKFSPATLSEVTEWNSTCYKVSWICKSTVYLWSAFANFVIYLTNSFGTKHDINSRETVLQTTMGPYILPEFHELKWSTNG